MYISFSNMNHMKRLNLILIALTLLLTPSFAKNKDLLTVAEKSNYTKTSYNADVLDFIQKLKQRNSKYLKVENIAYSSFGNEIPMLMIANPLPKSPADLKDDPRIVLYIQANIHAGEVEGKEASLMFARDLLKDMKNEIWKKLVLIIVPNLNPDGNDQMSESNRTNQNGPASVGLRHNGQMLDINRDGIKVETPELKGLLKNIFNKWDPVLTVDCHTTNGSYHEEPITFTWQVNPNGDRNLINYMRDKMMPEVGNTLRDKYKVENCYYGNFKDRTKPESGWVYHAASPRYMTNYIGLRNRFAILNENYVYADYKTRVIGCYYFLKSVLEYAVEHKYEMKLAVKNADSKSMLRGLNPGVKDSFALEYKKVPIPYKIKIKAIEAEYTETVNGWRRYKPSDRKREVTVTYTADNIPTKQIEFPYAYLINIRNNDVLNNLKHHGIRIEKLSSDQKLNVEEFKFKKIEPQSRHNQGHYLNKIDGDYITVEKEFKKGTYVIRTAQKLGSLIVNLLEPHSDDNLLKWNFFDRNITPQWGRRYYPYPVYKVVEKTIIDSQ